MKKPVFPVALILEGRACLVVGTGPELDNRTRALLAARARPIVVSPQPSQELAQLAAAGTIELRAREFVDGDLNDIWLAVLVDANAALAARMARIAEATRVLFCAVDQPEHNSYAHMAQARAGLLTIAITTAGEAPALGRRLREELERLLSHSEMAEFAAELAALREVTPSAERKRVLGEAVAGVHFTGELKVRG